jgi:hypothetical protein
MMSGDSDATWHRVEVGQLYSPTRTRWPETPHLRLSPGGCDLALFLAEPSADEASEVRSGTVSFAWIDGGPVSVLCFRFGALPWMDTPFEPWQLPASERGVPAGDPNQYLLLQITLVDAATGIVRAMRVAPWTPDFGEQVRETLRRQLAAPGDHAAAVRRVEAMYQKSSQELAEEAEVRCSIPQLVLENREPEDDAPPDEGDGANRS